MKAIEFFKGTLKARKTGVLALAVGFLLMTTLAVGCSKASESKPGQAQDKPPISSQPAESKVTVTLYFSDDQAMYLVPEQREVTKRGETLEEVIIAELINGPVEAGLGRTIPKEAKLLSVSVVDNVAYVNFSKEFRTKHWGGSTGETHTIYSVVNSLTQLDGIDKVQFLLEGDNMDTLAGHIETSEPIGPNMSMVRE